MNFKIYTKDGCLFCKKAKEWFDLNKIKYEEINLNDNSVRASFYEKYDVKSVPQIFIGSKIFGDFSKLENHPSDILIAAGRGGLTSFSKTYKPFLYPWAVELTDIHEDIHWTQKEADLQDDVSDWKSGKLSDIDKEYITNILKFFTTSDVAVGQNYCDQLIPKFKNNEIRNMLVSFCAREGIHQRAYALLNDTLGLPESEYNAFLEFKVMSDKFDYMMEYDNSTMSGIALCLAKSVFNEGVSLFASFVMLLNFQRFGKMKGMGKIVEWSIRDETKHVEGISKLFRQFCKEHPRIITDEFKKSIYDMAREIVKLEDKFIALAYKMGETEGLSKDDVKKYIRYITDRRLIQLGMRPNYKVKENPLPWLDWVLNGVDHTNFFENRVTEYEIASSTGNWSEAYDFIENYN